MVDQDENHFLLIRLKVTLTNVIKQEISSILRYHLIQFKQVDGITSLHTSNVTETKEINVCHGYVT